VSASTNPTRAREIAIVGMACRYPDADSPQQLWENVLAQRRAFRRLPDERMRLEDYYDPDPTVPDRTYVAQAAVIEGWEFDRVGHRVAGSTYRAADVAHWLALDVAESALTDAGFGDGEGLPRRATGVHLGNTLTGEFSRANVMRLRWPYVRRVVDAQLATEGWSADRRGAFLAALEQQYKKPFPPIGNETLAGGLSNTIAGRICNHFDLKGGGYTVDGACSASLLSVITACTALANGDLDVSIAGGVDLSLDPFELVGFAKTGALAPEEMRVYDTRAGGFWPGEGCGFVVLMRRDEAEAQGRRIYALLRGWGVSSDGSGGITRPDIEGQILALRRAYGRAGFGIDTVGYHEGHGTGTRVGDATELDVLSRARRECGPDAPAAAIGSIKANIGHTKAAAGVAGLIKATCAVHEQIVPPATGCTRPHELLTGDTATLHVLRAGAPWPSDGPRRASVSAMGFGGINTHVVLEGATATRGGDVDPRYLDLLSSRQDAELILLDGRGPDELAARVEKLLGYAERLSRAEVGDLAAELSRNLTSRRARAAVVASSPNELATNLRTVQRVLAGGDTEFTDVDAGVFVGMRSEPPRIGYVFPGQGSPAPRDGGALLDRFADAADLYEQLDLPDDVDAVSTLIQQPAIVTASMAALRVLARLGLEATAAAGHSLGELTALHWAGAYDEETLLRVATARAGAMARLGSPTGAMASIAASRQAVRALIESADGVVIAGLNAPEQTVVSGSAAAIDAVVDRARADGLRATRLPVSHAFHSKLVEAAVPSLAEHLATESFTPPTRTVASTITGRVLEREIDVSRLLCEQVTAPVRFTDAAAALAERVDLLIEVGPGRVLTGLLEANDVGPAIPVDAGGESLAGLLRAVGCAYAMGAKVRDAELFEDRFTRPFSLDWEPTFLANPCEQAPDAEGGAAPIVAAAEEPGVAEQTPDAPESGEATAREVLRRLVAEHAELPLEAVGDTDRFLSDLHLNSLTVGQLISDTARRVGVRPPAAPTDYADSTIDEVVGVLEQREADGVGADAAADDRFPPGVDTWVRAFSVEMVDRARPAARAATAEGTWRVMTPPGSALDRDALAAALRAQASGAGIAVCVPPHPDETHVEQLLDAARAALDLGDGGRFVVIQQGGGAAGIARTAHLEMPKLDVCVVDVAPEVSLDDARVVDWVAAEAAATCGFGEAHYDADGRRREPRLAVVPVTHHPDQLPLTATDTMLVTGGGKGITAECALAIAERTGARMILLGRSSPVGDSELAANLDRFAAHGIDCRYVAADVTDADAVAAAVAEVQAETGPITAVLHGAGLNEPRLLGALSVDDVHRTLAPKVAGLQHVLDAVDPAQLRLLVTFSSIIGRMGLQGEGDYALANEWLSMHVERWQAEHPDCRCLSLEWSVWSGVGMGQRLGRVDVLTRLGITPISPEAGTHMLLRLLGEPVTPTTMVVSGRFGTPSTVRLLRTEQPLRRFLQTPRVDYPGVELIVDADVSRRTDPYVDDHVYEGRRLFPAVVGLEAMAQVAMTLTGASAPPWFERVVLDRPVMVPDDGTVTVRVAAIVRGPGIVDVAVRTEETGFQADHFRARCRFGTTPPTPEAPPLTRETVELDIDADVYDSILFQDGRFRRLTGYRTLSATECAADIGERADAFFGSFLPADLVLGDPGARDAALHALQACIPHRTILPTGVERIVRAPATAPGPRTVHAREIARDGDLYTYDLLVVDAGGNVAERWEGVRLKAVGDRPVHGGWPVALLGPCLQRRLEALVDPCTVRVDVRRGVAPGDDVARRADGRPDPAEGAVSIAHAGALTLTVTDTRATGGDVEPVAARGADAWRDLLGPERFALAELIARERAESPDTAATRVWTAIECVKKAGLMRDVPITLAAGGRGAVVMEAGSATIATWCEDVRGGSAPFVFAILVT
jgi:enediyne polyketide synthase